MASWRAFKYALLAFSPVSSHGMCLGLGIAWAAKLFSPFRILVVLPFRAILRSCRDAPGVGDGDILTISARVLGAKFSLWPWPWPPLLPWCFLACLAEAELKEGKASASSSEGAAGAASFCCWCLLLGRDRGRSGYEWYDLKPGGGVTPTAG